MIKDFSISKFRKSLCSPLSDTEFDPINCVVLGGVLSPREVFERYSKGQPLPDLVGDPLPDDRVLRPCPRYEDSADAAMHAKRELRQLNLQLESMLNEPSSDGASQEPQARE